MSDIWLDQNVIKSSFVLEIIGLGGIDWPQKVPYSGANVLLPPFRISTYGESFPQSGWLKQEWRKDLLTIFFDCQDFEY